MWKPKCEECGKETNKEDLFLGICLDCLSSPSFLRLLFGRKHD